MLVTELVAVGIRAEVLVNDGKRRNNLGLQNEWCSDGSTSIWSERIREFKVRKCAAHYPDQSRRILKGNAHWLALREAGTSTGGVGGPSVGYITFDLLHNLS